MLRNEVREKYYLQFNSRQVDTELMIEKAEKEILKKDLGEMLSHNYDLTANNLDSLKKWLEETLHELNLSKEELKLSNEKLNTSHQELKLSHQELQILKRVKLIRAKERTSVKQFSRFFSLQFHNTEP